MPGLQPDATSCSPARKKSNAKKSNLPLTNIDFVGSDISQKQEVRSLMAHVWKSALTGPGLSICTTGPAAEHTCRYAPYYTDVDRDRSLNAHSLGPFGVPIVHIFGLPVSSTWFFPERRGILNLCVPVQLPSSVPSSQQHQGLWERCRPSRLLQPFTGARGLIASQMPPSSPRLLKLRHHTPVSYQCRAHLFRLMTHS